MDAAVLAAELQGPAYAGLAPDQPGRIVELLNSPTESMIKSKFITARTVLAELGPEGALILDKLEAFVAGPAPQGAEALHSATKWAMRFLSTEGGLDIGHDNSQSMVDMLESIGVLTSDEGTAVKDLAERPASRMEVLFGVGSRATEDDVRAAIAHQQG